MLLFSHKILVTGDSSTSFQILHHHSKHNHLQAVGANILGPKAADLLPSSQMDAFFSTSTCTCFSLQSTLFLCRSLLASFLSALISTRRRRRRRRRRWQRRTGTHPHFPPVLQPMHCVYGGILLCPAPEEGMQGRGTTGREWARYTGR